MRSLNFRSFVSALQVPVLAIGMLFASGCFKTTAIIPTYPMAMSETRTMWTNGFFWGAVGDTVDTGAVCGGRPVMRVTTDRSFGNAVVSWVTLGIYTPSRLRVTCGQAPVHAGYYQNY
ncbi:MAG TPA: hypothetical protein PKL17_07100 [Pseudomonadota bacterium]|nr:hypothetical protein [Pseudomonadota bacterium]HNK44531.1 hypothetical protein [Pseudomonadota bacterium]